MNHPDFDHFCRLVQTRSGLALNGDKVYLVKGRLEPIARSEGLGDVAGLLAKLRTGAQQPLMRPATGPFRR